jgi:hypothetical protein
VALSNWDTLCVDLRGEPVARCGIVDRRTGVAVDFCKNWLYIRDPRAWRPGRRYVRPTVAEVHEGELSYGPFSIRAIRGPQEGIFAAVWHEHRGRDRKLRIRGIAGCAVYGYDDADEPRFVGVSTESLTFLRDFLTTTVEETDFIAVREYADGRAVRVRREPFAMRRHLYGLPDEFTEISLDGALRMNQGDAYFADALGAAVLATAVGDAAPTIMSRLIGGAEGGR